MLAGKAFISFLDSRSEKNSTLVIHIKKDSTITITFLLPTHGSMFEKIKNHIEFHLIFAKTNSTTPISSCDIHNNCNFFEFLDYHD